MELTSLGLRRSAAVATFALMVPMILSGCAAPFSINPELADEHIPPGAASVNPLRTDDEFRAAMGAFPIIGDASSDAITVPGLYGAHGLAKIDGGFELERSDTFTPQGLAVSDEFVFISAYDHEHELNSVIFVLDFDGNFVKTIALDNKAHVGGIGYDREREVLWVGDKRSGHAVISGVEQEVLDQYDITSKMPVEYGLSLYVDSLPATSTLSFAGDFLWAGYFSNAAEESQIQLFSLEFTRDESGEVQLLSVGDAEHIRVSETGELHISADAAFQAPKEVQGLGFDGQYLYVAQSFGTQESKLSRYELAIEGEDVVFSGGRSVALPPYLEQIGLADTEEGLYILPLFESAQPSYRKKVDAFVDRVVAIAEDAYVGASEDDSEAPKLVEIPVSIVE
ncbi:hypothetical protein ASD13_16980 [Microbacterium sp. Root1433D1]|uniref:hypothetical protein n=1 Tax=Microbacterium sp. Root1433D1 TaxID=1736463 RepID=UPI000701F8EF|nr:hypothetical protein [Microbacterium sp. Root1433D1]KQY73811.1 hypothetical protein ASD13_16980 [Microbacterium sp. Root1433D1]